MTTITPKELSKKEAYLLMTSLYIPRPIAFVGTVSDEGVFNCAPFSYSMGVSSKPPLLMFSVADKRDGTMKDTLANIRATGEYTINIVNEPILRPMHKSADPLPPEESEFDHTGLTPTTSELIRAPGVLEAPITLELTVRDLIRIEDAGTTLVLGEVVLFHVDDAILKDGVVDAQLLGAVGRLGFNQYAIVRDVVDLSGA